MISYILYIFAKIMSNPYFRFKKFTVWHDRCAMPVGTDGVLLGAWAELRCASRILDVGTGSGLLALMAAQRNDSARVIGIDVDSDSVSQAAGNVASSPFSNRIEILLEDVRRFRPPQPFDSIICNPPFYTEAVLPPDEGRSLARNTASLRFSELIESIAALISDQGVFNVIIPTQAESDFISQCLMSRLYVQRLCHVKTVQRKEAKRVMATFSKSVCNNPSSEVLVLMDNEGRRTSQYIRLTSDFYL